MAKVVYLILGRVGIQRNNHKDAILSYLKRGRFGLANIFRY